MARQGQAEGLGAVHDPRYKDSKLLAKLGTYFQISRKSGYDAVTGNLVS